MLTSDFAHASQQKLWSQEVKKENKHSSRLPSMHCYRDKTPQSLCPLLLHLLKHKNCELTLLTLFNQPTFLRQEELMC